MKKISLVILLFAVAVISAYIIYLVYPSVNPLGAVKLDYNARAITTKAEDLINQFNLNTETKTETTTLLANSDLIMSLYDTYSFSETNKLLRDKIPGYYWAVEWKSGDDNLVINGDNSSQSIMSAGDIILHYDTYGNLIKFKQAIKDSIKYEPVAEDQARLIALDFVKKYSPVTPERGSLTDRYGIKGSLKEKDLQKTVKQTQTEYEFSWEAESADINNNLILSVNVTGNKISEYDLAFSVPDSNVKERNSIFTVATTIPFYIVVYILIIIIGFRRIRAYEVSFRLALIMGLIVGVTFSINLYTIIADSVMDWKLWLSLVFSTFFLTAVIFITWAVSETIAREAWKGKFVSLDLLTKGYVFHSRVGYAGITGLTAGFFIYLVWTGILFGSEQIMHISFFTKNSSTLISQFHSVSPALNIINKSIFPQIYTVAILFLFVYSGLKRRFSSLYLLIPISAVLWGIVNYNDLIPIYWGIITGIFTGVLFLLLFNYFDVLTLLVSLTLFNIIDAGVSLFTAGNSYYLSSGYYLILVFIVLAGFFIIGLYTKDKITDFESITPAFVKNITERQRMQRELEIARDVQMSFLPVKNPQFKGLDIAAQCIPAFEVGGDYYDFVKLDENRLGIIIGDVSGKGTQAAFYMTLAKGFVKALSKTEDSPSEFLIKFNELFYENVERGTFISMIYGIVDIKNKTLTFARAGHNPVIARHSGRKEIELLNPVGLALGLEKGTIFGRTIKEIKVDIKPGDTFVFYTDGFTEARNRYKMEFTEERLKDTISKNIELTAEEMLEKTIEDVKAFTGKILQHDDMTMVVVKFTK